MSDQDDDDDDDSSDDNSASEASTDSSEDSDDESEGDHTNDKVDVPMKKRAAEDGVATPAKKTKVEVSADGNEGSKNLFVGNLSWNVDEEWLAREFEEFGELSATRIISDRNTGRSKGLVLAFCAIVHVDADLKLRQLRLCGVCQCS